MFDASAASDNVEGGSTEGPLGPQGKTVQIQSVRAPLPRQSEEAPQRRGKGLGKNRAICQQEK